MSDMHAVCKAMEHLIAALDAHEQTIEKQLTWARTVTDQMIAANAAICNLDRRLAKIEADRYVARGGKYA